MAQLARIVPDVAVACPGCDQRLSELPLDELAAGKGYSCPHCCQDLRIPPKVLARLLQQREAATAAGCAEEGAGESSAFARALAWLREALRRLLS